MKAEHTPGPWYVEKDEECRMTTTNSEHTLEEGGLPPGYTVRKYRSSYDLIQPNGKPALASVSARFTFPVARARLQEKANEDIAREKARNLREAAPALLEACRAASASQHAYHCQGACHVEQAQAALAQATREKTP